MGCPLSKDRKGGRVSSSFSFDDRAASWVEALYQTPEIIAQRHCTLQRLSLQPGEQVLDIGTGPGFLLAEMAEQVGPHGHVSGVDASESMLALARSHCARSPHSSRITLVQDDVMALPFPDATFDVAAATQVYSFVGVLVTALAELYRVLRPAGRALILETDWDSLVWHASDQTRMNRLMAIWCERFRDPHLPRTLSRQLREAGFQIRSREVLTLFNPEYDPNSFSARQMEAMSDFAAGRHGMTRADVEAWMTDLRQLGQEGRYFFSLNRYLFLVSKPD